MDCPQIVILGAGVSGLAAALSLKQHLPGDRSRVLVLEQHARPGGLMQCSTHNGHVWDNGAFIFRPRHEIVQLLPELFVPAPDFAVEAAHAGRLAPYPISPRTYCRTAGPAALLRGGLSYLVGNARRGLGVPETTLRQWFHGRLGAVFTREQGLEVLAGKLQDRDAGDIAADLGRTRLRYVERNARPGALLARLRARRAAATPAGDACYPRGAGVGAAPEHLARHCEAQGVTIRYARCVRAVQSEPAAVHVRHDGPAGAETTTADYVISTLPLDQAAVYSGAAATPAQTGLYFTDLRLCFFAVARPQIRHQSLVLYSLEPHHPWKRLTAQARPGGLTNVAVEVTYDPARRQLPPDLATQIEAQLTDELGLFTADEIVARHTATVPQAYPILEVGCAQRRDAALQAVQSPRLRMAGRQGRFDYFTSSAAMRSGTTAAAEVLAHLGDAGPGA